MHLPSPFSLLPLPTSHFPSPISLSAAPISHLPSPVFHGPPRLSPLSLSLSPLPSLLPLFLSRCDRRTSRPAPPPGAPPETSKLGAAVQGRSRSRTRGSRPPLAIATAVNANRSRRACGRSFAEIGRQKHARPKTQDPRPKTHTHAPPMHARGRRRRSTRSSSPIHHHPALRKTRETRPDNAWGRRELEWWVSRAIQSGAGSGSRAPGGECG